MKKKAKSRLGLAPRVASKKLKLIKNLLKEYDGDDLSSKILPLMQELIDHIDAFNVLELLPDDTIRLILKQQHLEVIELLLKSELLGMKHLTLIFDFSNPRIADFMFIVARHWNYLSDGNHSELLLSVLNHVSLCLAPAIVLPRACDVIKQISDGDGSGSTKKRRRSSSMTRSQTGANIDKKKSKTSGEDAFRPGFTISEADHHKIRLSEDCYRWLLFIFISTLHSIPRTTFSVEVGHFLWQLYDQVIQHPHYVQQFRTYEQSTEFIDFDDIPLERTLLLRIERLLRLFLVHTRFLEQDGNMGLTLYQKGALGDRVGPKSAPQAKKSTPFTIFDESDKPKLAWHMDELVAMPCNWLTYPACSPTLGVAKYANYISPSGPKGGTSTAQKQSAATQYAIDSVLWGSSHFFSAHYARLLKQSKNSQNKGNHEKKSKSEKMAEGFPNILGILAEFNKVSTPSVRPSQQHVMHANEFNILLRTFLVRFAAQHLGPTALSPSGGGNETIPGMDVDATTTATTNDGLRSSSSAFPLQLFDHHLRIIMSTTAPDTFLSKHEISGLLIAQDSHALPAILHPVLMLIFSRYSAPYITPTTIRVIRLFLHRLVTTQMVFMNVVTSTYYELWSVLTAHMMASMLHFFHHVLPITTESGKAGCSPLHICTKRLATPMETLAKSDLESLMEHSQEVLDTLLLQQQTPQDPNHHGDGHNNNDTHDHSHMNDNDDAMLVWTNLQQTCAMVQSIYRHFPTSSCPETYLNHNSKKRDPRSNESEPDPLLFPAGIHNTSIPVPHAIQYMLTPHLFTSRAVYFESPLQLQSITMGLIPPNISSDEITFERATRVPPKPPYIRAATSLLHLPNYFKLFAPYFISTSEGYNQASTTTSAKRTAQGSIKVSSGDKSVYQASTHMVIPLKTIILQLIASCSYGAQLLDLIHLDLLKYATIDYIAFKYPLFVGVPFNTHPSISTLIDTVRETHLHLFQKDPEQYKSLQQSMIIPLLGELIKAASIGNFHQESIQEYLDLALKAQDTRPLFTITNSGDVNPSRLRRSRRISALHSATDLSQSDLSSHPAAFATHTLATLFPWHRLHDNTHAGSDHSDGDDDKIVHHPIDMSTIPTDIYAIDIKSHALFSQMGDASPTQEDGLPTTPSLRQFLPGILALYQSLVGFHRYHVITSTTLIPSPSLSLPKKGLGITANGIPLSMQLFPQRSRLLMPFNMQPLLVDKQTRLLEGFAAFPYYILTHLGNIKFDKVQHTDHHIRRMYKIIACNLSLNTPGDYPVFKNYIHHIRTRLPHNIQYDVSVVAQFLNHDPPPLLPKSIMAERQVIASPSPFHVILLPIFQTISTYSRSLHTATLLIVQNLSHNGQISNHHNVMIRYPTGQFIHQRNWYQKEVISPLLPLLTSMAGVFENYYSNVIDCVAVPPSLKQPIPLLDWHHYFKFTYTMNRTLWSDFITQIIALLYYAPRNDALFVQFMTGAEIAGGEEAFDEPSQPPETILPRIDPNAPLKWSLIHDAGSHTMLDEPRQLPQSIMTILASICARHPILLQILIRHEFILFSSALTHFEVLRAYKQREKEEDVIRNRTFTIRDTKDLLDYEYPQYKNQKSPLWSEAIRATLENDESGNNYLVRHQYLLLQRQHIQHWLYAKEYHQDLVHDVDHPSDLEAYLQHPQNPEAIQKDRQWTYNNRIPLDEHGDPLLDTPLPNTGCIPEPFPSMDDQLQPPLSQLKDVNDVYQCASDMSRFQSTLPLLVMNQEHAYKTWQCYRRHAFLLSSILDVYRWHLRQGTASEARGDGLYGTPHPLGDDLFDQVLQQDQNDGGDVHDDLAMMPIISFLHAKCDQMPQDSTATSTDTDTDTDTSDRTIVTLDLHSADSTLYCYVSDALLSQLATTRYLTSRQLIDMYEIGRSIEPPAASSEGKHNTSSRSSESHLQYHRTPQLDRLFIFQNDAIADAHMHLTRIETYIDERNQFYGTHYSTSSNTQHDVDVNDNDTLSEQQTTNINIHESMYASMTYENVILKQLSQHLTEICSSSWSLIHSVYNFMCKKAVPTLFSQVVEVLSTIDSNKHFQAYLQHQIANNTLIRYDKPFPVMEINHMADSFDKIRSQYSSSCVDLTYYLTHHDGAPKGVNQLLLPHLCTLMANTRFYNTRKSGIPPPLFDTAYPSKHTRMVSHEQERSDDDLPMSLLYPDIFTISPERPSTSTKLSSTSTAHSHLKHIISETVYTVLGEIPLVESVHHWHKDYYLVDDEDEGKPKNKLDKSDGNSKQYDSGTNDWDEDEDDDHGDDDDDDDDEDEDEDDYDDDDSHNLIGFFGFGEDDEDWMFEDGYDDGDDFMDFMNFNNDDDEDYDEDYDDFEDENDLENSDDDDDDGDDSDDDESDESDYYRNVKKWCKRCGGMYHVGRHRNTFIFRTYGNLYHPKDSDHPKGDKFPWTSKKYNNHDLTEESIHAILGPVMPSTPDKPIIFKFYGIPQRMHSRHSIVSPAVTNPNFYKLYSDFVFHYIYSHLTTWYIPMEYYYRLIQAELCVYRTIYTDAKIPHPLYQLGLELSLKDTHPVPQYLSRSMHFNIPHLVTPCLQHDIMQHYSMYTLSAGLPGCYAQSIHQYAANQLALMRLILPQSYKSILTSFQNIRQQFFQTVGKGSIHDYDPMGGYSIDNNNNNNNNNNNHNSYESIPSVIQELYTILQSPLFPMITRQLDPTGDLRWRCDLQSHLDDLQYDYNYKYYIPSVTTYSRVKLPFMGAPLKLSPRMSRNEKRFEHLVQRWRCLNATFPYDNAFKTYDAMIDRPHVALYKLSVHGTVCPRNSSFKETTEDKFQYSPSSFHTIDMRSSIPRRANGLPYTREWSSVLTIYDSGIDGQADKPKENAEPLVDGLYTCPSTAPTTTTAEFALYKLLYTMKEPDLTLFTFIIENMDDEREKNDYFSSFEIEKTGYSHLCKSGTANVDSGLADLTNIDTTAAKKTYMYYYARYFSQFNPFPISSGTLGAQLYYARFYLTEGYVQLLDMLITKEYLSCGDLVAQMVSQGQCPHKGYIPDIYPDPWTAWSYDRRQGLIPPSYLAPATKSEPYGLLPMAKNYDFLSLLLRYSIVRYNQCYTSHDEHLLTPDLLGRLIDIILRCSPTQWRWLPTRKKAMNGGSDVEAFKGLPISQYVAYILTASLPPYTSIASFLVSKLCNDARRFPNIERTGQLYLPIDTSNISLSLPKSPPSVPSACLHVLFESPFSNHSERLLEFILGFPDRETCITLNSLTLRILLDIAPHKSPIPPRILARMLACGVRFTAILQRATTSIRSAIQHSHRTYTSHEQERVTRIIQFYDEFVWRTRKADFLSLPPLAASSAHPLDEHDPNNEKDSKNNNNDDDDVEKGNLSKAAHSKSADKSVGIKSSSHKSLSINTLYSSIVMALINHPNHNVRLALMHCTHYPTDDYAYICTLSLAEFIAYTNSRIAKIIKLVHDIRYDRVASYSNDLLDNCFLTLVNDVEYQPLVYHLFQVPCVTKDIATEYEGMNVKNAIQHYYTSQSQFQSAQQKQQGSRNRTSLHHGGRDDGHDGPRSPQNFEDTMEIFELIGDDHEAAPVYSNDDQDSMNRVNWALADSLPVPSSASIEEDHEENATNAKLPYSSTESELSTTTTSYSGHQHSNQLCDDVGRWVNHEPTPGIMFYILDAVAIPSIDDITTLLVECVDHTTGAPLIDCKQVNNKQESVLMHAILRRWPSTALLFLINTVGMDHVLTHRDAAGRTALDYMIYADTANYAYDVVNTVLAEYFRLYGTSKLQHNGGHHAGFDTTADSGNTATTTWIDLYDPLGADPNCISPRLGSCKQDGDHDGNMLDKNVTEPIANLKVTSTRFRSGHGTDTDESKTDNK